MISSAMIPKGSTIDPYYSSGEFLANSSGERDAKYKVLEMMRIVERNKKLVPVRKLRVADVGCGSGLTSRLLYEALTSYVSDSVLVVGYDVHPGISKMPSSKGVHFVAGDFCTADSEEYDIIVLFDVIEHIPNPMSFLQSVSKRCKHIVLHLPLDNSILAGVRNLASANLKHPGHLVILDMPSALNLLAFSGLRTIDYEYSPIFNAPSGRMTRCQRTLNPLRKATYRFSPYITQKFLGGVSLTVLASTPLGLSYT